MGAILITKVLSLRTKADVKKWYRAEKKRLMARYKKLEVTQCATSTAYTGDFATFDGYSINFFMTIAPSKKIAIDRIQNSQKWDEITCTKYKTRDGHRWLIGGWAGE